MLILGSAESGKSTIAKQFRIINDHNFNEIEIEDFKKTIHNNVISSVRTLIQSAQNYDYKLETENEEIADEILNIGNVNNLSSEYSPKIQQILNDKSIDKVIKQHSSEIQLIDSASYFFENLDRIAADDYVPNDQDILRSRKPTVGIVETSFALKQLNVKLVDVAGQKNKRHKWIHLFDNVQALIFCADISGYDMKLREDENINRVHDALELFKETINSKWFLNTDIILFLNKTDIFQSKIETTALNVCFPEYDGGNNYVDASEYIQEQFFAQNTNPSRNIFCHFTCATDTDAMTVVFLAIQTIILNASLAMSGLALNNNYQQ